MQYHGLPLVYHNWLVVSTPLKNMKVGWNDSSQYMENKIHVPNHQLEHHGLPLIIVINNS